MISEKEFLNAVAIVREYQSQIKKICTEISETPINKTLTVHWLDKNRNLLPARLINILSRKYTCDGNEAPLFVEDFNKRTFFRMHGAGRRSWELFCEFRNIKN